MKILVTGGCGYIGSHTLVDLIENGFEVVSLDDNSRSDNSILQGVAKITGKTVQNHCVNLCDLSAVQTVFEQHPDIQGIIHFAAYKSVPESVGKPLLYYQNNISGLLNLLSCVKAHKTPYFVFSSSCSVYGNASELPVTEQTPLQEAESPYASTKQMGEDILQHFSKANPTQTILLRYFNPVGAHPSAHIGERQEKPENLVPYITQTAIGKRKELTVFGNDYETRDGTCIRDYIHVMDIANAHTKAIQYLLSGKNTANCDIFNLGTGNGVTVLEIIESFERVSGKSLNYRIGERRAGDVVKVFANNNKAKNTLGWNIKYDLDNMMSSAWKWECRMAEV